MSKIKKLLDDHRPIQMVEWPDNSLIEVGTQLPVGEVTEIVAYGEPAEYCMVPWIAVYVGDEVVQRIPAGQVRIIY